MGKVNLDALDSVQYDVLKEIGNIGAGNATTALAKLINTKVDMKVPKVNLVTFQELASYVGSEEEPVVGTLLSLSEDINGMMLFVLDLNSARELVNSLLVKMGVPTMEEEDEFGEMQLSALSELGNIITGAYLSALSNLTKLNILTSVPTVQIDMAGAIFSIPAIEFGKVGDKVLFIETSFNEENKVNGYFILVPELESYDVILNALGIV